MQIGQRYYGVASVLALLLVVPSAPVNADGTTVLYSSNGNGTFSPTATYLVDHQEAIDAYELSPAFQAEGGDTLYSTMADGTGIRIGSGTGFVQFLEDNYARVGGVASNQACDEFVRIIWKFSCLGECRPDPLDCELFLKAEAQITCKDEPECPPTGKTTCADFPDRINKIIVFGPTDHVCFCDLADNCLVGEGFEVLEFTSTGPVCECVEERKLPSDPLEPCQNHWAPDPGGAKRNRTGCFKMPASAAGQQVAIRVTLRRLYIDSDKDLDKGCPVRTPPLKDLSQFEGEVRYLGPPSAFNDNSAMNPKFIAAELQCTQFFRDWSPAALAADFPGAVDTRQIYYYGAEVFPCSIHDVQQATENCKETADPENCYSAPLEVRTSLWGDVWPPFNTINFTDIGKVVDAFKSIPFFKGPPASGAPRKVRAMLRGNSVPLGSSVSFTDIGKCVDAFKTIPYREVGPVSCP